MGPMWASDDTQPPTDTVAEVPALWLGGCSRGEEEVVGACSASDSQLLPGSFQKMTACVLGCPGGPGTRQYLISDTSQTG